MYFVLVAGGPGTGKTTIVNGLASRLRSLGYRVYVIRDWAREIIRREMERSGRVLPWVDRRLFEYEVLKHHLEEYRRVLALSSRIDVVVEDGGPFAAKAYCDVDGVPVPELYNEALKYVDMIDLVVLTDTPKSYAKDSERWEDLGYALKIHRAIVELHMQLFRGRTVVSPYEDSPSRRVEKLLSVISPRLERMCGDVLR